MSILLTVVLIGLVAVDVAISYKVKKTASQELDRNTAACALPERPRLPEAIHQAEESGESRSVERTTTNMSDAIAILPGKPIADKQDELNTEPTAAFPKVPSRLASHLSNPTLISNPQNNELSLDKPTGETTAIDKPLADLAKTYTPQLPAFRSALPYKSAAESQTRCRQTLDEAAHEYRVGAWLSAEASAWHALAIAVDAIEITDDHGSNSDGSQTDPVSDLQLARAALIEARDFAQQLSAETQVSLETIVRSHRMKLIAENMLEKTTPTQAMGIYLEHAREMFAVLANQNVQAAEAMDLLAAIYLGRNDPATMPTSTSLCLRRAALQGQPTNANLASRLGVQLAKIGLLGESRRVLEHSLSMRYDRDTQLALAHVMRTSGQPQLAAAQQAEHRQSFDKIPRKLPVPEVIQLSPEAFAAVSPSIIPQGAIPMNQSPTMQNTVAPTQETANATRPIQAKAVSYRMATPADDSVKLPQQSATDEATTESPIRRTLQTMRNWW
ncbi:hypothetical protein [Planctomycetes bacterium CA13]|uniref:hypothetical protein n=1 Tax=Novipirellula herctigrandis TaxID=2527986 RepID=UPI0011B74FAF